MNRILLTLLIILSFNTSNAQIDRQFWFAIPKENSFHGTIDGTNNVSFKVTAQNLDTKVTISMPANGSFLPIVVNVPARTTKIVVLATNFGQFAALYANPGALAGTPLEGVTNKGIYITSDNDVSVYYDYDNVWNRELFTLKGKNALGTEFYTPFQNIWKNDIRPDYKNTDLSEIDIVATQDGTHLSITPSVASQSHAAGLPFPITLNKGQTYSLVAKGQSAADHLSGTRIVSLDASKPIAVTINDDSSNGGLGLCADINGDQLVPINLLGTKYLVMTGSLGTTHVNPGVVQDPNRAEQIFITVTQNNTIINYYNKNGDLLRTSPPLNAMGIDYLSPDITDVLQSSIYISSNHPIYVYHLTGITCEVGGAILPSISDCSGSNEITFFRSSTVTLLNMNLMVPFDNTVPFTSPEQAYQYFTITYADGTTAPIPSSWFEPIDAAGWAVLKLDKRSIPTGFIPVGQPIKISNTKSNFQLGLSQGSPGSTNKYGYFSTFGPNQAEVRVGSTETGTYMGCLGNPVTMVASGGLAYTWHYGSPTGPATYISDPTSATPNVIGCPTGSHKFYVEIKTQCQGVVLLPVTITIIEEAEAKITANALTICAPGILTIKNNSIGNIFRWTRQINNNPLLPFFPSNDTLFQESLTNNTSSPIKIRYHLDVETNSGCSDTASLEVTVYPNLSASFNVSDTAGCNALNVNFTNTSAINATNFEWNFGDGTTSKLSNPSHLFNNQSSKDTVYKVKLIAYSANNCVAYDSALIVLHGKPYPQFSMDVSTACAPYNATINNMSDGSNTSFMWDLGDSTIYSGNVSSFSHMYRNTTASVIMRTIKLIVTNSGGCKDSVSKDIILYPEVHALFTATMSAYCSPRKVDFVNQSNMAATKFIWDFGDNTNSLSKDTSHLYSNNTTTVNIYHAFLVAISAYSCKDSSEEIPILVYPYIDPYFAIDKVSGCSPLSVAFTNGSSGPFTFESWDFNDGQPPQAKQPANFFHIFQNTFGNRNQSYAVTLRINYNGMCQKTYSKPVIVYAPVKPLVSVNMQTICNNSEITFMDSTNRNPVPYNYRWEFGDGASNTGIYSPNRTQPVINRHTYENYSLIKQTLQAKFEVNSQFGCNADTIITINVLPGMKASFSADKTEGVSPLAVNFTNNSFNCTSFLWDFDDSFFSTTLNPTHVFTNTGTSVVEYTVKLGTKSECEIDTAFGIVKVLPKIVMDVSSLNSPKSILLFPNPTKGKISMQYNLQRSSDVCIELMEPSGKILGKTTEVQRPAGENIATLDLGPYKGNLFFIRIILNGESTVFKVIKEN